MHRFIVEKSNKILRTKCKEVFYSIHSVFVTLELINSSQKCDINTLEIEALVHSSFMTGLNRSTNEINLYFRYRFDSNNSIRFTDINWSNYSNENRSYEYL
jgi:hypothetical protein